MQDFHEEQPPTINAEAWSGQEKDTHLQLHLQISNKICYRNTIIKQSQEHQTAGYNLHLKNTFLNVRKLGYRIYKEE